MGKKKDDAEATGENKGNFAAIHASGFRDFLLKAELLRAIVDCSFEHPSEIQHECIPQAILGTDILCQAKSGMGKTAVFALGCLQQVDVSEKAVKVLVMCHTRELAYQIKHEFDRFAKYFQGLKTGVVYGGLPIAKDKEMLRDTCPHIMIGTPGRVLALVRDKDLKLDKLTQFILDECDRCLDKADMRKDIQQVFVETPKKKQIMMFSATMSVETRAVCKRFMQDPHEIRVDEESKLTLHGLLQYYVKLSEKEKNRKLNDIERVNIVINYDMPEDSDSYLHRVGRAGRFGTKGLALTFVSNDDDTEVLKKVQGRFEVNIGEMPNQIDTTSYLNA